MIQIHLLENEGILLSGGISNGGLQIMAIIYMKCEQMLKEAIISSAFKFQDYTYNWHQQ
jgi:hypothetical protein